MAIIRGNVVGRARIKDLNIILEYKQEINISDNDFLNSKDLKNNLNNGHVVVIKKPIIKKIQQIPPKIEKPKPIKNTPKVEPRPQHIIVQPKQEIKVIEREIIKEVPANQEITEDLQKFKKDILNFIAKISQPEKVDIEKLKNDITSNITNVVKSQPQPAINTKELRDEISKTIKELLANNYIGSPKIEVEIPSEKQSDEPVFIPKVRTENVKSNIKIEEEKTTSVDDSLEAIKRLKKKKTKSKKK